MDALCPWPKTERTNKIIISRKFRNQALWYVSVTLMTIIYTFGLLLHFRAKLKRWDVLWKATFLFQKKKNNNNMGDMPSFIRDKFRISDGIWNNGSLIILQVLRCVYRKDVTFQQNSKCFIVWYPHSKNIQKKHVAHLTSKNNNY